MMHVPQNPLSVYEFEDYLMQLHQAALQPRAGIRYPSSGICIQW
jgi:hypothetical protein